ncbi:MAG TPA: PAS domain-containing protein [Stellaceae bacterium]|nr:PAS domain-containing protein [Stellaceae bacterium]
MQYDFHTDAILGPAYEYWRSKCGARAMPRRRDIDPTEISHLLPNIQISELIGARIRYRLAGTAIIEAYGSELKGKYFDEVFSGERLRFIENNYRMMCKESRPIIVRNRYHSKRDAPLICTRLIMPLSDDGETVTQCLTAMSFQFPGEAREWTSQWFGNGDNFDFARSYAKAVG